MGFLMILFALLPLRTFNNSWNFRPNYSISTFYSSRGFMAVNTEISFPEKKGFRLTLGLINYAGFGRQKSLGRGNLGLLDVFYQKDLGFLKFSARLRYLTPLGSPTRQ